MKVGFPSDARGRGQRASAEGQEAGLDVAWTPVYPNGQEPSLGTRGNTACFPRQFQHLLPTGQS